MKSHVLSRRQKVHSDWEDVTSSLPEDVTSFQFECTFRRQLKTWLFNKSFPDIII